MALALKVELESPQTSSKLYVDALDEGGNS